YDNLKAKGELDEFLASINHPKGIHLCGNPDWEFMLNLDMDILSMDIYTNAEIFAASAGSIKRFLKKGNTIVWGIVPTGFEIFEKENLNSLVNKLEEIWKGLNKNGVDMDLIIERSLLSPATCCLINPDGEKTVEQSFEMINKLSEILRSRYKIS
ncbi:MAG: hypothetical protein GY730_04740, partial [bacterium]|nr:hypothetical protein [bacterium]